MYILGKYFVLAVVVFKIVLYLELIFRSRLFIEQPLLNLYYRRWLNKDFSSTLTSRYAWTVCHVLTEWPTDSA